MSGIYIETEARSVKNEYGWCHGSRRYTDTHIEVIRPGNIDLTVQAQMVLSAILRAPRPVEASTIVNTLLGTPTEDVLSAGMNEIKTFGVGRDIPQHAWFIILREMARIQLVNGLGFTQELEIGRSANWKDFLRGTNRFVLDVAEFRSLERQDAIQVLTDTLTERDPDGRTEHSREDRLWITPSRAAKADRYLAVLSGEKSLVAEHLTYETDHFVQVLKLTVDKIVDGRKLGWRGYPSGHDLGMISKVRPQSMAELESCFDRRWPWFDEFGEAILATVTRFEGLEASAAFNENIAASSNTNFGTGPQIHTSLD